MGLLSTHSEIEELGGGRVRQEISIKRIADWRNGNLYRLLNQLGNTGDPNLPVGLDEAINFRIRDRLAGQSPLLFFGRGQSNVRITALNTNNVNGIVAGQSIVFPNAWNNADLKFTTAGHRLQKDVLLKAGYPASFQFRLDAHQNFNVDTLSSEEFQVLPPILLGPQMQSIPLSWAKSVQGGKTVLTVTLPPGDYAGWTLDPTMTLQPDATDGKDAAILKGYVNNNAGVSTWLSVGNLSAGADVRRSLIQFSAPTLPAGAVVSSYQLHLYCNFDGSSNARTFRIYRMKQSWTEGTGSFAASGDGATWNTYNGVNNWTAAGAFHETDCEQSAIGSRDFTATETLNEFKIFTFTPTTWADMDLGNGWLAKADTENADGYEFDSSDHATAANRPKLTVEYQTQDSALYRRFMMTR